MDGTELLSACPARYLMYGYNEYPHGLKAAASLAEPRGASSNSCSRKCAICVFMEVPLAVSQECEGPIFQRERDLWDISTSRFWLSHYKNLNKL